jgi:hypothetical protein
MGWAGPCSAAGPWPNQGLQRAHGEEVVSYGVVHATLGHTTTGIACADKQNAFAFAFLKQSFATADEYPFCPVNERPRPKGGTQ